MSAMNSILRQMTGEELLGLCAVSGRAVFDAVDVELDRRARVAHLRRMCEVEPHVTVRRVARKVAASLSEAA
ncbi:MAG: hypothetical protein NTY65_02870 [Planctomycetota bacterium]|jgi:hypothetical protein|nr:hypothetical protein [Planctomycetota bacterium]